MDFRYRVTSRHPLDISYVESGAELDELIKSLVRRENIDVEKDVIIQIVGTE